MKPNIGISEKELKNSCSILSVILADEMTLYVKTRKAHWNVEGESFMELHKLLKCEQSLRWSGKFSLLLTYILLAALAFVLRQEFTSVEPSCHTMYFAF